MPSAASAPAYIGNEQTEVRRTSSVVSANPDALRQRFQRMSMAKQEISDEEKGVFGESEKF